MEASKVILMHKLLNLVLQVFEYLKMKGMVAKKDGCNGQVN